jgi:hypothetical protein
MSDDFDDDDWPYDDSIPEWAKSMGGAFLTLCAVLAVCSVTAYLLHRLILELIS